MRKQLLMKTLPIAFIGMLSTQALHAQQTFDFETSGDTELWEKNYGTTTVVQTTDNGKGVISFDGAGKNATLKRFVSSPNGVDANSYTYAKVVVKNLSNAISMRIGHDNDGGAVTWTPEISITTADTDYKTYFFAMSSTQWVGEELNMQVQFRLDNTTSIAGTITIDEIEFFDPTTYAGIVQNPSFDDGMAGTTTDYSPWNPQGRAFNDVTVSTEQVRTGTRSLKVNYASNHDGSSTQYIWTNYSYDLPSTVSTGTTFDLRASYWVYFEAAEGSGVTEREIRLQGSYRFLMNDVQIEPWADGNLFITDVITVPVNTWTEFTFEGNAVSRGTDFNQVQFRPVIHANNTLQAGEAIYIDDLNACFNCSTLSSEKITIDDTNALVYPNPVEDRLNVAVKNQTISKIEIYAITGAKVVEAKNTSSLNVSNLNSGIYVVKIYSDTNVVSTKRFIKK
ncbi:T9SS type A sorting domain-containing protein [Ochrovirga pacifica]|uniref:T9SS type A sorting domain-containing protein n=1 Tax=Ochrovirga pacifica TaxID=1042376 RepID=UPI00049525A0|nr:T9SS type A sorting domain-containing protein [Ochrovirga pacifica]